MFVDIFNDEGEILGLKVEQVCRAILFAVLEHMVADFRIIKVHVMIVKFLTDDFILLKNNGHFLKSLSVCSLTKSGVRDF